MGIVLKRKGLGLPDPAFEKLPPGIIIYFYFNKPVEHKMQIDHANV
ncbi:MAG: hypothetical protein R2750_01210 [Bacteroidales bacterium]